MCAHVQAGGKGDKWPAVILSSKMGSETTFILLAFVCVWCVIALFITAVALFGVDDGPTPEQKRCLDIQRRLMMQPSYRASRGLQAPDHLMSMGTACLRTHTRAPTNRLQRHAVMWSDRVA